MKSAARLALWSVAALIASPAQAQRLPPDVTARIDAIFDDYDGDQPGCAVGVYRSGNLVFGKGYGLADIAAGTKITPATLFNVASLSKQFTAFAIALLERDGRVSLDAEVQAYVPELPRFAAPITVRHLVHHTSGLRDYGALLELTGWRFDQPLSRGAALAVIRNQRDLNFAPGTRHEYNNSNYLLLALIVERVAGQSLDRFTRQHIFAPLSMARTLYRDDPNDPRPVRAANYTRHATRGWTVNHVWDRAFAPGAVGVHTSIDELAKWDRNFLAPTVGDQALIRTLTAPPPALVSGKRLDYGFGLDLSSYRGLRAVSHGGQGGGTFYMLRLPDRQLSVATLCNRYSLGPFATDSAALTWSVIDLLIEPLGETATAATAPAPEILVPAATLADFVGDYWREAGAPLRIRLVRGRLVELLEGKADPMIPIAAGRFRSPDGKASYDFGGPGNRILTYREPATDHVAVGERREPWTPSARLAAAAAGRYCTDEVPVCWSLLARRGGLTLRRRGFPDRKLEPAYAHTFTLVDSDDIGTRTMRLALCHAADGTIAGFRVSRGRITGLSFDKRPAGAVSVSNPGDDVVGNQAEDSCRMGML